jgi:hypothetical protein
VREIGEVELANSDIAAIANFYIQNAPVGANERYLKRRMAGGADQSGAWLSGRGLGGYYTTTPSVAAFGNGDADQRQVKWGVSDPSSTEPGVVDFVSTGGSRWRLVHVGTRPGNRTLYFVLEPDRTLRLKTELPAASVRIRE